MNILKKGDVFLVAVLLIVVIVGIAGVKLYNSSGTGKIAVITQNSKVIKRINLDTVQKSEKVAISGKYNEVILIEKGRIRFEEADCPDRVCVKTGWLSNKGDTAVCLPNRTYIKIEGESEKVDITTF